MSERVITIAGYPYQTTHYQNTASSDRWLLLHGFMGSRHDFDAIAPALPGEVLVIDLLGFGTEAPLVAPTTRFAMHHQIADIRQILFAYQWEKVHLVGYSMGGRLALGFALAHPEHVETLVLESTTAGLADAQARAARLAADAKKAEQIRQNFGAFVTDWGQLPLFASQKHLPAALRQRMSQQRLQQQPENVANALIGMGTGAQPNFWPKLAQLRMKTTLIVGEQDLKFNHIADQLLQSVPHAQKVVIGGAGHNTHFEQPEQFNMRLIQHVSR